MTSSTAVKDVLVILASGIAILIGLVILVYIILLVFDKYCCCCPWWSPVGELQNSNLLFPSGRIGQQARLVGITSAERREILEKVLISKTYAETLALRNDNDTTNNNSSSSSDGDVAAATATTGEQKLESCFKNDDVAEDNDDDEAKLNEVTNYNESMCAICINDYEEEDIVTHGTSCQHIFHKECLLEWLDEHDVCPTCRKDMMTAEEMKNAAKSVLTAERANEIASIWSNNVPLRDDENERRGEGNDDDNALEMAELGGAAADSENSIAVVAEQQSQRPPIAQAMHARNEDATTTTTTTTTTTLQNEVPATTVTATE